MLLIDEERALRITPGSRGLRDCVFDLRGGCRVYRRTKEQMPASYCELRVGFLSSARPGEWCPGSSSDSCST
jgi:hypothetical protein